MGVLDWVGGVSLSVVLLFVLSWLRAFVCVCVCKRGVLFVVRRCWCFVCVGCRECPGRESRTGRLGCEQAGKGRGLEGDVRAGQIRVGPRRGVLSPVVVAHAGRIC